MKFLLDIEGLYQIFTITVILPFYSKRNTLRQGLSYLYPASQLLLRDYLYQEEARWLPVYLLR